MNHDKAAEESPSPFYVVQTDRAHTKEYADKFIQERVKEAKSEGAQLIRVSVHPDYPAMLLIEGWKEKHVPDQGHPRWAFTAQEPSP